MKLDKWLTFFSFAELVSLLFWPRFDRVVRVDVPDASGREEILKVHTRKMLVDKPAVLRAVAEITPGECCIRMRIDTCVCTRQQHYEAFAFFFCRLMAAFHFLAAAVR